MANLFNIKTKIGDKTYGFVFDWDDEAFGVEGQTKFKAKAWVQEGDKKKDVAVSISFRQDEMGTIMDIYLDEDKLLRSIPLTEVGDDNTILESIINRLPAWAFGDPLVTCFIRSTTSSVIGQALKCRKQWFGERVLEKARQFLRCMKGNAKNIGLKAARRFVTCLVTLT